MFPGQRVSKRNQDLESMAMDSADHGDYDDFGLPTRPASGASKSRSNKLLGRFRKQSHSPSAGGGAAHMDGDSDEEDDSYVPPGSVPPAAPSPYQQGQFQGPAQGQFQVQQPHHAGSFQQLPDGQLPNPRGPHENGSASPHLPTPQGEISMDQISSLRDRHRYPGFEEDAKSGRTMSLGSMSAYDTTPVIPMLGPVTNFQSGSTHNRATPQEKYRQRMIESRRALLSSETAIPLSGNPVVPARQQAPTDPYLANLAGVPNMSGTPRSMSLSNSALGGPPGGGGAPGMPMGPGGPGFPGMQPGGSRSMTMMSGPPAPVRGPPGPGGPHHGGPMYYNGPYGPPHNASPGPGMGPGMPYGAPPRSQSHQNLAWNAGPYGNYPQQPMYQGAPSQGNLPRGGPGGPLPPHAYQRDPHPAVNSKGASTQSQYDSGADGFDFGADYPSEGNRTVESLASGTAGTSQNGIDSHKLEELNAQISERDNEIRVLSIELAESSRRELHLPLVHDKDAQERAAALAKAHDELSLERARRTAAEKSATNPDVSVHEKLAEMDHRHSEAVHLLATRTEQYELLQKKFTSLSIDYERQGKEFKELSARLKENEMDQSVQHQDQLLGKQVQTLEIENTKLRKQIDESSPQGRLSERVVDLEEQRKALQETLRTMRERKDSEINALRSRLEQLQQQVQKQQQQRGRITSVGSSSGNASGSAGNADGSGPLYRPTPVRVMSRHPSNESVGDDSLSLSMPRIRDSGPARPATPLHLRINYEKHEAV